MINQKDNLKIRKNMLSGKEPKQSVEKTVEK